MANSGDETVPINSDASGANSNFWDVNYYKTIVKRMEDGAKLCEDFMKMITERAEIEALYSNKMRTWSKKWEENHKKSTEYGALKTAMFGIMVEGDQLADVHYELREKLLNEVHQSVSQWKKDNYHKSIMSYKEVKNVEEGFGKAQKPWNKKLDEVNKAKKTYHNSCRNVDNGKQQQLEAKAKDSNEEQLKKLEDKIEKCQQDVKDSKMKYEESLRDLNGYVPKYKDDMKYSFNKCQEHEELRKSFFESLLLSYHKAVTREEHATRMSAMYQGMIATFKKTATKDDLEWYADFVGVNSELKIPQYEEYDSTTASPQTQNNTNEENSSAKRNKSGVCTTL
ncbi:protein kinase C and casein kinase substrate in neurons protein 1-like [Dendronephthya gigantea]|uniref:protein kinase C and casein kinase substrate in neurons protein 1-like n=1 Tax=Dendronephthya gigantea TaxID=151771 RepID=UPI00106CE26C|nr:protein kinase C and casein kinase substrate in neurons protein 1-like [Dendronephthya gigantea]